MLNREHDERSSMTMNTQRIDQIVDKAETTEQKVQAGLYKDFFEMKKFVEEPTGVTGTRVKTFSGHPSDLIKAGRETMKKSPD